MLSDNANSINILEYELTEKGNATLSRFEHASQPPNILKVNSMSPLYENTFRVQCLLIEDVYYPQSQKICSVKALKLPVVIYYFLKPKLWTVTKPKRIIINPIIIKCIVDTDQEIDPEDSHSIHSSEYTTANEDKEIISMSDLRENPGLIFYRQHEEIPEEDKIAICLCDSCYFAIRTGIDGGCLMDIKANDKRQINCEDSESRLESLQAELDSNNSDQDEKYYEWDKVPFEISLYERLKDEGIDEHCNIVNDHLLNRTNDDAYTLKNSVKVLRHKWLKTVGCNDANMRVILFLLDYFQSYSENLLKMIICTTDTKGNNVLHFAFGNNRFDIADLFIKSDHAVELLEMKNEAGHSALLICAISEPETDEEWLTVYNSILQVDISQASDYSGQTPLMTAACRGSDLMVQLLLDIGADPNVQDSDGSTALMYAAQHGHEKCVTALLDHPRCDPAIKDQDDETACSVALSGGHKDIALIIYLRTKIRDTKCPSDLGSNKEKKPDNKSTRNSPVNIYTISS